MGMMIGEFDFTDTLIDDQVVFSWVQFHKYPVYQCMLN